MNKLILLKNKYGEPIILVLIGISILIFCSPFLSQPFSRTVSSEFNSNIIFSYFARNSLIKDFQLPLRCPYYGGGYPLISYSHDMSCSPLFPIILIFGELLGMKIILVVFYMACAYGMFYLTRKILNFNLIGSLLGTLSLTFCNWIPLQMESGNFGKAPFIFVPLLVAFIIKSRTKRVFIIYAAFVLSLVYWQTCSSYIAIVLFILIFTGVYFFGRKGGMFLMLGHALLAIILSLLFCAVQFIPLLELLYKSMPQINYENTPQYGLTLAEFLKSVFSKQAEANSPMYIGYGTVFLALLSFVFNFKQSKRILLLLVLFIIILLGQNSFINLLFFLSKIPILNFLIRIDKHFSFFIAFFLCLAPGYFLKRINASPRRNILMILAVTILIINTYDLFFNNMLLNKLIFNKNIQSPTIKSQNFSLSKIISPSSECDGLIEYELMKANIGSAWGSHTPLPDYTTPKYLITSEFSQRIIFNNAIIDEETFQESFSSNINIFRNSEIFISCDWRSSLNPKYKGELYFLKHNALNTASYQKFTPNIIVIDSIISKPDILIINQNYDKYWRVEGGALTSQDGLLAIKVDTPGKHRFKLTYVPTPFIVGLIISMLTIVICISIIFFPGRYRELKRRFTF